MSHDRLAGVFITGTDTEIGKTTIACALAWLFRINGIKVGIMKPFATSSKIYSSKHKSKDTFSLTKEARVNDPDRTLNPVFFPIPASPAMASEILHKPVDLNLVNKKFSYLKKKYDFLVVEGIGGVMVPIKDKVLLIDVIRSMKLPVIIVSSPKLGSINHTVLTINACIESKIPIIGLIFNQMPKHPSVVESMTPLYVQKLCKTKTISTIPFMDQCSFKKIGLHLGRNEIIKEMLSSLKTC